MSYCLIEIFPLNDPDKKLIVCDLDSGCGFADPLEILYRNDYDLNDINDEGLYAIGGSVSVELLSKSYKWGIFPWFPYKVESEAFWYCPKNRYVIFPEEIHVSHSLRTVLNRNDYKVTFNKCFPDVIENCSKVNGRADCDMAWLGNDLIDAFIQLHKIGLASSVEVWKDGVLAGGLYGFWHQGVFQGESMFSLIPNGSKIALISLASRMSQIGGKLIDCQFKTPFFQSMGARYIDYRDFRMLMEKSPSTLSLDLP